MRGKGSPDFVSVGKYDQFQKGREGRWCTSQNPARSSPQYKRVGKGASAGRRWRGGKGIPVQGIIFRTPVASWQKWPKPFLEAKWLRIDIWGPTYVGRSRPFGDSYVRSSRPTRRFTCQKFPSYSYDQSAPPVGHNVQAISPSKKRLPDRPLDRSPDPGAGIRAGPAFKPRERQAQQVKTKGVHERKIRA